MQNIFNMTRERLDKVYTKDTPKDLYNNVTNDAQIVWNKIKATPETIKNIVSATKKLKK